VAVNLGGEAAPFFQLACGGFYFGCAGVGIPVPVTVPDMGTSIASVTCNGTTLTLSGTTPAEAGGNRCSGGTNHHNACTANADCPGGACKFLRCTNPGCLFGPPLPIPASAHNAAAISTCVINTVSQNASGTADCGTGTTTSYSIPLSSAVFLTSDLMLMRCSGGSNPGGDCTGGGGCGTVAAGACPGGTCANDTGRCTTDGSACCADTDCTAGGTCETGACAGGANAGRGCITDADCPSSSCKTFIQPCPICNATTNVCNGGPNRGLTCTPGDSIPNGDYPTSHDCPPPPPNFIGAPPIALVLDSGTISRTAVDLSDQVHVFCGFCKNGVAGFARTCNGSPTGALCSCAIGTPCTACSGAPCLAVSCASNADCTPLATRGFGSCGQRTPGAFTANDLARTIVEQGAAAGPLTTGGAAAPETLVSIFCIQPTFNALVDAGYDLPGPGAVALSGTTQLQ